MTHDHPILRFDGQVAVVTGAGTGIGRAHALMLAARGASVVVNDLGTGVDGLGSSSSSADAVVAEILASGGTAVANYDGVHISAGADAIIRTAIDAFGRLDILVCNAGILTPQPFEELTDDVWNRTIGIHLNGTMFTARAAWRIMKPRGYGRLIFTASSGGLYGKGGLTAYGAAKGGIYGLMRCLHLEAGGADIRVNTILPGASTRMLSPASIKFYEGREGMGDPMLVSALVAYLAHRDCRDNGHAYSVGGGYYARDEAMQGQGVRLGYSEPVTPERIAANWDAINSLGDPAAFESVVPYAGRMFDLGG